jgi:hypothetical protein
MMHEPSTGLQVAKVAADMCQAVRAAAEDEEDGDDNNNEDDEE